MVKDRRCKDCTVQLTPDNSRRNAGLLCRPCVARRQLAYQTSTPELREANRLRSKAWHEAHRAESAARSRARHASMRDEIAAARRIRYATDPEFRRKASAQAKARYARNRAPFIAKAIQWCRTNPERKRATSENRRAVKAMATGTITPEAWQAVLHQFSNACAHCLKTGEPMTMDHVLALSRGGSHEIDNVVPLCKSCNSSKREWGVLSLLSSDFRLRP